MAVIRRIITLDLEDDDAFLRILREASEDGELEHPFEVEDGGFVEEGEI